VNTPCRECGRALPAAARLCPQCLAPATRAPAEARPSPRWLVWAAVALSAVTALALAGWALLRWYDRAHTGRDPVAAASAKLESVLTLSTYDEDGAPIGQGSGFLADTLGLAVTDFHVLAGASRAEATLGDGRLYDVVEVRDYDPDRDVCVFRIGRQDSSGVLPPAGTRALVIRRQPAVHVGERIAAIGSPQGLENTLSDGVVSAIREDDQRYLQFTAPISPGSSGGPLFDAHGQVVGVVVSQSRTGQNLNFAIPAAEIAPHLAGSLGWSLATLRDTTQAAAERCFDAGQERFARGDYEGALDQYERARQFDPGDHAAAYNLALCYLRTGDEDAAVRLMREFLELAPADDPFRRDARRFLREHSGPE
jgi:S1-C subfamily serine protease